MKKIAIFGGGIGGLSVAHELCKYKDYDIEIYERNDDIGGLARSKRDEDGCATEYSWRVFFGFYDNLFKTFSEIKNDDNKTNLDNLTKYKHFNVNNTQQTTIDYIYGIYKILSGMTSCNKRLDRMDNKSWYDELNKVSNTNIFRSISPWLGLDRYNGSYRSVIKSAMELHQLTSLTTINYKDYVINKPTNEAIFYPWQKHLEKNGVKIYLNTSLNTINIKDNEFDNVEIYNANNNTYETIKADYYVFNLPVEVLDKLIDKTPQLNYGDFKNIKQLKNTCLHHQLSFQVFFNKHINLNNKNGFLIVDSKWDLIILSYDNIFDNINICNKINNIVGGWSIGVCTSYVPGIVFKKSFDQCTYEEIIIEIWAQIKNSKNLNDIIKQNNNFYLTDDLIVKWSKMWDTWYRDKNGNLQTTEPKFTNNKGSYALRPSYQTHIKNLYLSTAYIKETIDIFSMEGANIAGKRVAHAINNDILEPTIRKRPLLFSPFRMLDNIFYKLRLPNINVLIIIILIILILRLIYKKLKKINK